MEFTPPKKTNKTIKPTKKTIKNKKKTNTKDTGVEESVIQQQKTFKLCWLI